MQSNFSKNQLSDADNASSDKIFKKCVHCGMCMLLVLHIKY